MCPTLGPSEKDDKTAMGQGLILPLKMPYSWLVFKLHGPNEWNLIIYLIVFIKATCFSSLFTRLCFLLSINKAGASF